MNTQNTLFNKSELLRVIQGSKINTIEDIKNLTDNNVFELLSFIDKESLLHSMQAASPKLREKIFYCMNQRPSLLMQEDLEGLPPLPLEKLQSAQINLMIAYCKWELFGVPDNR